MKLGRNLKEVEEMTGRLDPDFFPKVFEPHP